MSYLLQHHTYTHFKKYLTQDQIIQYIQDGHWFGFVEYDIEVPNHLREPLFRKDSYIKKC